MLDIEKVEKIATLSADKEYDGVDVITYLQDKGIKPIIDIRNHWKEETKQYKDTDLIYTYDGKVSIVEDNGDIIPLKYLGYDKVKNTLERINGRMDRDFNLENHKVRGLKKAKVMIDIMMIGMMAMAKGHIINKHPENIRKLKLV